MIQRLTNPFRRLRGKLTLSYMLTSVLTFLLIELLIGGVITFFLTHIQDILLNNLQIQARQATPYLANAAHDPEALGIWLHIAFENANGQDFAHSKIVFFAVTDTRGLVIASDGSHPPVIHTPLVLALSTQDRPQLQAVLNDPRGATNTSTDESDQTLVEIVPILDKDHHVQGTLVMKFTRPDLRTIFSGFFALVLLGALVATILAAILSAIFGYLSARGLTRRLNNLSTTAALWSRGDFSRPAQDGSRDELGQMTNQLNHMAEELQNLLHTRQQLATLEERNRLARDLHDSVKQQIFAVSMQIGATKHQLKRDPEAAEARLLKAEKLVQQAQQELTSLIRELRPVALEGKGLIPALHELLPQWSQQSDIVANLRVEGTQPLPLTVEEALFRVAQEALSNVARHSHATLAQLTLSMTDEMVTLTIQDNGQGCDPARLVHRGVGLHSMQERMQALGGDMRLQSTPNNGTRVIAFCTRLGTTSEQAHTPVEKVSLSGGNV